MLLGFGVLLANGSYLYMKGCGGVQVHSATRMPVDEVTVALGVFCRLFDVPERAAGKHLDATQAEHFDEGYAWASSNAAVVRMLRASPDAVRAGAYTLSPSRSWLSRILVPRQEAPRPRRTRSSPTSSAPRSQPRAATARRSAPLDAARAQKLAELKALVDESLDG